MCVKYVMIIIKYTRSLLICPIIQFQFIALFFNSIAYRNEQNYYFKATGSNDSNTLLL
ncbi:hypothetical protein F240042I4_30100 [Eisenbergiella tayi]